MRAMRHPHEEARLAALASFAVLDTEREKEFDDIVNLLARICDAPIAVVNLIDAERQWFKAEVGLNVSETPLETSICSHVILQDRFVEISDTQNDPRMIDNPLVCGNPGLRFYAGALLLSEENLPIGTLCVLDYEPRTLTNLQRDAVRILAAQVMAQLNLRRELDRAIKFRQEADHRIKNSLQTVSSLIRYRSRDEDNEHTRDVLDKVLREIGSVASVHELLHQMEFATEINMERFAEKFRESMSVLMPDNVSFQVAMESISLPSNEAVCIAILANEFISNALKHAFPDQRGGVIKVQLTNAVHGGPNLIVIDDGVGLRNVNSKESGLGTKIAKVIAMQLNGEITLARKENQTWAQFAYKRNG